ncbi:TetR/AcrR family transcriptional regulator [Gorillibacterium sp. sgz500922]|uniref:TetR/AcrR family transcriptional regulator n=1 Tax=Gorillibacterium sp. sgz500922 TaxID=3446694 RepID=UPI003F67F8E4
MSADSTKDQLLKATIRLLADGGDYHRITARQIAEEAGANLAMINYYYSSKDALMSLAVDRIIAAKAKELGHSIPQEAPPQEKLRSFLIQLSDMAVAYAELTRPTIPYLLLHKEIETPYHILPYIRACCGSTRNETECRIIAYQLASFFKLVFYRSEDFFKYANVDVEDKKQRDELVDTAIRLYLEPVGKEESGR